MHQLNNIFQPFWPGLLAPLHVLAAVLCTYSRLCGSSDIQYSQGIWDNRYFDMMCNSLGLILNWWISTTSHRVNIDQPLNVLSGVRCSNHLRATTFSLSMVEFAIMLPPVVYPADKCYVTGILSHSQNSSKPELSKEIRQDDALGISDIWEVPGDIHSIE